MTESALERLRREFPVVVEVSVAWSDMDALQHVNNTVFFRCFEEARIAYLRRIALAYDGGHEGVGPILASTHCRFRRPVVYPDRLHVGARTVQVEEDRFTMEYRLVSERLEEVAAEGGGVVVAYDYRAGRKAPLPPAVREAIARVAGGFPTET